MNKTIANKRDLVVDGITYREVDTYITCSISNTKKSYKQSLTCRSANGNIAGNDVRIIHTDPNRKVDFRAMCDHEITSTPIVMSGGVFNNAIGPIIVIMHQHACYGKSKSIYSSTQMHYFKNTFSDKLIKAGGEKNVITNDDYVMTFSIKNGLPCITLQPYTAGQWDSLPHNILTSDLERDQSIFDIPGNVDDETWNDAQSFLSEGPSSPKFDEYSELRGNACMHEMFYFDAE